MQEGFIMLQRRFFSHSLWEETREFSRAEAFLDLLQLAAYAHTKKIIKGSLVKLAPGQLCGSQRYLADRWGWSTKKVRHFIALLESDGIIEPHKNREGTILTLCNYDSYNNTGTSKEPQKTQEGTTEEPLRNQIKEREEREEGKKTYPPTPTAKPGELIAQEETLPFPSDEFQAAWDAWRQHRKEIRKKLTPESIKANFKEMLKWGEARSIAAIWFTIRKGWQGLREADIRDIQAEQPTYEAVAVYCAETEQPPERSETFYDRMSKYGWHDCGGPIIDWKAAFRLHCINMDSNKHSR